GATKEEWKMVVETKKILDPKIKVTATCVRVPVFVGHSEAINLEFEKPISPDEARDILREAPGVSVIDRREAGGYATPIEAVGEVPPLLLTALRYVVAAIPAVFFIGRPKVALGILVGYGLAVGVGQFGLLFAAIKLGMPAGLASLVIQLQVFFTVALAVLLLG